MRQYKVAQRCQEELDRLDSQEDGTEREKKARERVEAISIAVQALAALHLKEISNKLKTMMQHEKGQKAPLDIHHSREFLNNNDPLFWYSCCTRLFPRGECAEKIKRTSTLPSWRWAKCLLTRADFPLWRLDVESVASLFNIFLRRAQVGAV